MHGCSWLLQCQLNSRQAESNQWTTGHLAFDCGPAYNPVLTLCHLLHVPWHGIAGRTATAETAIGTGIGATATRGSTVTGTGGGATGVTEAGTVSKTGQHPEGGSLSPRVCPMGLSNA